MATKQTSILVGYVAGTGKMTTSVTVSGSEIRWNASFQYISGASPTKIELLVYDKADPGIYDITIGRGESRDVNPNFSGSWKAEKTSGTVTFEWVFYGVDDSQYEWASTREILTDNYSGAKIYSAPTCGISIQSESSFYPGGTVSLRLNASGELTTGVLRRFYKAPGASTYSSQNVRTGLTNSFSTISDTIPNSSAGGQVYWDYTVSDGSATVSSQTPVRSITANSAPSTPSTLTVPSSLAAGQSFSVSWSASTDPDGNLAGYILERSIDGGSSWTTVYQGSALTTTDTLNSGTTRVRYRVKAYDTFNAASGYKIAPDSGDYTVTNNHAPTVPASPISISPSALYTGGQAVVSWGESTDEDGDSFEYVLERSVDNLTSFTEIYSGTSRNYADTVGNWSTVTYRVKAVDSHGAASGYRTADTKTVASNNAPSITCSYADGEDLGTKSAVFDFVYSVNDANASDTLTVKEIVDGVVKKTIDNAVRNQNYTFNFLAGSAASSSYWNKILNGSHTITISVTDGSVTVSRTFTFLKNVGACLITLAEAITSARNIEKVAVSICGSIPAGGFTAVQVTADDGTHWEDCVLASGTGVTESGIGNRKKKATGALTEELLGGHYLFIHTMTNTGKKFNFRIQAEKVGDEGGFISSVQGTFTEASA